MSHLPGRSARVRSVVALPCLMVVLLAPGPMPGASDAPVDPARVESTDRATRLIGNARLGRRKWVTGAAVLVRPEAGEPALYLTATDEKGVFRFESLPEGEYRVELVKHGLEPIVKTHVRLAFPFRAVVEVTMEPTETAPTASAPPVTPPSTGNTSLQGKILKRDGTPAREVAIRLVRADGTADPRSVLTDTDGRFRIEQLGSGSWRLEVLGAGFLPLRVPVDLAGDVRLEGVLVAQPANYQPQPLDLMPPELPIPPPEPAAAPDNAVADL